MHALVLIDHGSTHEAANQTLRGLASLLHDRWPGPVEVAHMEIAPPTLADALRRCAEAGAQRVTIVPYFLGLGRHVQETIPRLIAAASKDLPGIAITLSAPLGVSSLLAELVLIRAEEASTLSLADPPLGDLHP